MICPHCQKAIPDSIASKHFAAIGGKRSKRAISWTDQWNMQVARFKNAEASIEVFCQSTGITRSAVEAVKAEKPFIFSGEKVLAAMLLDSLKEKTTFQDQDQKDRIACLLFKNLRKQISTIKNKS